MGIFPHPSLLLKDRDPDGIIGVGDELSPEVLIEAYSKGIFPWPVQTPEGMVTAWFFPPRRAILEFDRLHLPRSLLTLMRKQPFMFSFNSDFSGVIRKCAEIPRKGQDGTWITEPMIAAYNRLHELGRAWSVEARDASGSMVAGIYGVRSDRYFSAESMFHTVTGASKLALLELIRRLKLHGDTFVDIQMLTPHLERLGAREIPRREFIKKLGWL